MGEGCGKVCLLQEAVQSFRQLYRRPKLFHILSIFMLTPSLFYIIIKNVFGEQSPLTKVLFKPEAKMV